MLLSEYLEADLIDGTAERIVGIHGTPSGVTFAEVVMADGTVWLYPDQNYAQTYGEIAREASMGTTLP